METKFISQKVLQKKWFLIDATGQTMGRLASKLIPLLQGKNKPYYSPNLNCGDNVIVTNCGKVVLTGNKTQTKTYYHHTGYIGNLKERKFVDLVKKQPRVPLEKALKGMLSKNKLGRQQLKNLYLYPSNDHKHKAQNPVLLKI